MATPSGKERRASHPVALKQPDHETLDEIEVALNNKLATSFGHTTVLDSLVHSDFLSSHEPGALAGC
jgi:hypothetical protein